MKNWMHPEYFYSDPDDDKFLMGNGSLGTDNTAGSIWAFQFLNLMKRTHGLSNQETKHRYGIQAREIGLTIRERILGVEE